MKRLYEKFSGKDLAVAELIQRRRLQMLVHSCLYYEMDTNLIDDKQWDTWARELVELQKQNPEISKEVEWYEAFKDWDASTGAFLPIKDSWVVKKAKQIYSITNRSGVVVRTAKQQSISNAKFVPNKSKGKKNNNPNQFTLF